MKITVTQKQGNSTLIVEFDFEKLIIKSHRNKEGEIFTYMDIAYPSIEKMKNYKDFLINEHKFTQL